MLEQDEQSVFLVDVREPYEFEADNLGGINIPLSEILDEIQSLPDDKTVIFYCNSGRRSKQAFELVKATNFAGKNYWV